MTSDCGMDKYLRDRPSFYFSFRNPISTLPEETAPRKAACELTELDFKTVLVLACLWSLWSYFGQHSQFLRISQIVLQQRDFFKHTLWCTVGTFLESLKNLTSLELEGPWKIQNNTGSVACISIDSPSSPAELCEIFTLDQRGSSE